MKQKGFTLFELLVALAISSVILLGLVLSIHHIVVGTDRNTSQTVALADVNQAALAIKRDLQMAQYSDLTSFPQSSALFTWTDYTSFPTGNKTHSSSYMLSGNNLLRTYDGTQSIVGRNITSVSFSKDTQNERIVNVIITSTGPGAAKEEDTLEFSVCLRSEEFLE